MATTTFILLLPILFLLNPQAQAQAPAPSPSGPINITAILEKAGQYTALIKILKDTQQLTQIQSQLKSNSQGSSLFAPTDNAFQNLPSGALNGLSDDQKVQLILYHVTPKYYSLSDLTTVSNPVRTQAPWGLNFTGGQGNQVNVSSGAVETAINNALRQQFPLAVYQVDKVLWPVAFTADAKSPSPAPAPKKGSKGAGTTTGGAADASPSPSGESKNDSNGVAGKNVGFGMVLGDVNKIEKLKDKEGNWIIGSNNILKHIEKYFEELFKTTNERNSQGSTSKISKRVSRDMNEDLTRRVIEEEIKDAVFNLGSLKAPSPDGLNGLFF
ncbi:hypothetical protein PIB30_034090 [Stylosanthes scabra]|uniref:FAS1 domain-containing protein n=1 Tax=Stylosanthes scabra TaxID=79078 RepID=A0ABU6RDG4_9FABA|nr:hypothetical protein [Stylosanthes scabra]